MKRGWAVPRGLKTSFPFTRQPEKGEQTRVNSSLTETSPPGGENKVLSLSVPCPGAEHEVGPRPKSKISLDPRPGGPLGGRGSENGQTRTGNPQVV